MMTPLSARQTIAPRKVTDSVWADVSLVPLALKKDVEADQAADSNRSMTIDSTVARALRDLYFDESGLAENTLALALKSDGIHGL